jgi:simple sugar transport system substrate-binding protein
MRKSKKLSIALIVALIVPLLFMTGCRDEDAGDGLEIVLVVKLEGVAWFDSTRDGITRFNNARPTVNARQIGHHTADPAAQVALVNDLIAMGVDAILVIPNDPASLVPAFTMARAMGITVGVHEASTQAQADFVLEPFDNFSYGAHMLDIMANWMGGQGLWQPFVGFLTSVTHNEWVDAQEARAREQWPGLTLAGARLEEEEQQELARQRSLELLMANPNLRGIMGSAMSTVPGAAAAITELGLIGQVAAFGTCLPSVAGAFLESGAAQSIHFWSPADAAYATALVAYKLLNGETIGGTIADGLDLGVPGYHNITIIPNEHGVPVIYGAAWVDVNRYNLHEWRNPDGSYRL